MPSHATQLAATKAHYPFASWQESGLDRYTFEACAAFVEIFDELIAQLSALGSHAPEDEKLACFQRAIAASEWRDW